MPADSDDCGNDAAEIAVTPEMVEAGVRLLSGYNSDFELYGDFVIRIYREMEQARIQCMN